MTGGSECSAKDVMEVVCWGKGERMFRSPEMQFSGAYAKWGLSDEAGNELSSSGNPFGVPTVPERGRLYRLGLDHAVIPPYEQCLCCGTREDELIRADKDSLMICKSCKFVQRNYYCSRDCQSQHRPHHKRMCKVMAKGERGGNTGKYC